MKKTSKIIFSILLLTLLLTIQKNVKAQRHSIHFNADYTLHKLMLDATYNLRLGKRSEINFGGGYRFNWVVGGQTPKTALLRTPTRVEIY